MTAQLLTSELSTLLQESKRKNPELRAVRTPGSALGRKLTIDVGRREVIE